MRLHLPYRLARAALRPAILLMACALPALATAAAPDAHPGKHRHIVKKGETLWSIANQHLDDPYKWRKLWKLNRRSIKNPHWIYPGQEIDLDKLEKMLTEQQPRWLNPGEEIVIEELLPALELAGTPDMTKVHSASFVVKKGDTLWGIAATRYKNHWKWKKIWKLNKQSIRNPHRIYPGQVFTLEEPLPMEPDTIAPITVKPVAVTTAPPPALPQAKLPAQTTVSSQPIPARPVPVPVISAHIISIYTGSSQTGSQIVVIIDKGRLDGIQNGVDLTLFREDKISPPPAASAPPATGYGKLQVFRTFDKTAYATVTQANLPVKLLDVAVTH